MIFSLYTQIDELSNSKFMIISFLYSSCQGNLDYIFMILWDSHFEVYGLYEQENPPQIEKNKDIYPSVVHVSLPHKKC